MVVVVVIRYPISISFYKVVTTVAVVAAAALVVVVAVVLVLNRLPTFPAFFLTFRAFGSNLQTSKKH